MPKGRPVKSEIRQNIVEILYFMKQGYGYEIYKAYVKIFPKVTMRSIYYHLKKGNKTLITIAAIFLLLIAAYFIFKALFKQF